MCDGAFLLVQWLKLHAANPWGSGCSLVRELDPTCHNWKKFLLQLRPGTTKYLFKQNSFEWKKYNNL